MYGVIEEANSSDHKGDCTSSWPQTSRLITWNMKHIYSTPITLEQYLCEQVKKAAGQLEDIFMQVVPLEPNRIPKPHTTDNKTYITHGKEILIGGGEKRDDIPPHQSEEQ